MTALGSAAWLPRFSLRQLLLFMALAAVGCYALRRASPWWSIVLFYADLALVVAGLLIAINWPGEPRSFWLGFVACASMHWLLAFHAGFDRNFPTLYPGAFVTHRLSAYCYRLVRRQLVVQPIRGDPREIYIRGRESGKLVAGEDGYFRGIGLGPFYIFEEDFVNVALGLWTLLVGYVGGQISLALYRWRAASAKTASDADQRLEV